MPDDIPSLPPECELVARAPDPALTSSPVPVRPSSRAALADAFLCEYHRQAAAALRAAQTDPAAGAAMLRRATTWRATAYRIRNTVPHGWPAGVLAHLARCAALPEIGPEYACQRQLLAVCVGAGGGEPSP
jgi:hypothetical protein